MTPRVQGQSSRWRGFVSLQVNPTKLTKAIPRSAPTGGIQINAERQPSTKRREETPQPTVTRATKKKTMGQQSRKRKQLPIEEELESEPEGFGMRPEASQPYQAFQSEAPPRSVPAPSQPPRARAEVKRQPLLPKGKRVSNRSMGHLLLRGKTHQCWTSWDNCQSTCSW